MELVKWQFENLSVPMVDIDGELYCTTEAMCSSLDLSKQNLGQIYKRNQKEFEELRVTNRLPYEMQFLQDHKSQLNII